MCWGLLEAAERDGTSLRRGDHLPPHLASMLLPSAVFMVRDHRVTLRAPVATTTPSRRCHVPLSSRRNASHGTSSGNFFEAYVFGSANAISEDAASAAAIAIVVRIITAPLTGRDSILRRRSRTCSAFPGATDS